MSDFRFKSGNEKKEETAKNFESIIKKRNLLFIETDKLTADETYELRLACAKLNIQAKVIKNKIAEKVLNNLSFPSVKIQKSGMFFIGDDIFTLNPILQPLIKQKKIAIKFAMNENVLITDPSKLNYSSKIHVMMNLINIIKSPAARLVKILEIKAKS